MARGTDHAHVVHEVLAAELGADTALLANLKHLLLPLQVAEAAAAFVTRGGQFVEITGRSLLHGREAHLGRRAADADGQVVGRAGRRTEVEDMGFDEIGQRFLVQQRLGLLVEESFVGRTAALGNEEEFVLHAGMAAVDVDLRGEVRAGVFFFGHGERHDLRIAQVAVFVGLVHALGNAFRIVGARIDILALMADTDGSAGILACGKFALGRNDLVEQHGVSHELVVVGGLGIIEDVAQFLQVGGAQVERHVAVRGFGQEFEACRVDLEDLAAVALDDFHIILRQQTVLGFVFPDGERLLINEISHNRDMFCVC